MTSNKSDTMMNQVVADPLLLMSTHGKVAESHV
jgi:hypothetical protein